jgi:hypothetical protein
MPRHVGPETSVVTLEEIIQRMRILPKSGRGPYIRALVAEVADLLRYVEGDKPAVEALYQIADAMIIGTNPPRRPEPPDAE